MIGEVFDTLLRPERIEIISEVGAGTALRPVPKLCGGTLLANQFIAASVVLIIPKGIPEAHVLIYLY